MRKITLAVMLTMMASLSFAQLVNDGATITIKNGATLFVESDVTNNGAGTIAVEGTGVLEVQGHLTNNATMTTQSGSKVKFSGTANSNFKSNGASISNLEISKVGSTVTLTDAATVTGNLNFASAGSSKLLLGNNNLVLSSTATASGYGTDKYVVTAGTGVVQKNLADATYTNQAFTFPVGDATNYSPLDNLFSGTTVSGNLKAKVNNVVHPSKPASAESFLNRYWDVDATGFTGYSNTLTGTYVSGDLNGTQALIKGAVYDATEWSYAAAATNATSTVTGSTDDASADFTGTNFYGKVNFKAILSAAYNTATNEMNTTLNAPSGTNWLETSALTSPYNAAPFNAQPASVSAGFFLANPDIVDWVMLELRDPSAPTVATTNRASAFLKKNGQIVGLDGTSMPTIENGFPTSVVALYHRNHLMVRTKNPGINVTSPTELDMRNDTTQIYRNTAITTNVPMKLLESTPNGPNNLNAWGLWEGDINQDGLVKYNLGGNDRVLILTAIGGTNQNATVNGYLKEDVNLNGQVKYNLGGNDRVIILQNIGGTNQNATISRHN